MNGEQLCEYGCGLLAKHQLKNCKWCCYKSQNSCEGIREKFRNKNPKRKPLSDDHKKRISLANSGKKTGPRSENTKRKMRKPKSEEHKKHIREAQNKPEIKLKYSIAQKEAQNRPEVKEKNRERALNGGAVYANQFIKNPSRPQVELFKMLHQLCPNPIMNYPIYYRKKWNYSIDIADSRLALAIEYDEPYWHKNKGRDLRRQKRIEELGWKFLRYEKLPALEQLKLDIIRVINSRS